MHNRYRIRRMDYVAYWIIGMSHLWDPCLHNCKWKGKVDYVAYWINGMGHLWDPYFHLAWPALIENLTFGSLFDNIEIPGQYWTWQTAITNFKRKMDTLACLWKYVIIEMLIWTAYTYIYVYVWISMCILLVNCWLFNTEWRLI